MKMRDAVEESVMEDEEEQLRTQIKLLSGFKSWPSALKTVSRGKVIPFFLVHSLQVKISLTNVTVFYMGFLLGFQACLMSAVS